MRPSAESERTKEGNANPRMRQGCGFFNFTRRNAMRETNRKLEFCEIFEGMKGVGLDGARNGWPPPLSPPSPEPVLIQKANPLVPVQLIHQQPFHVPPAALIVKIVARQLFGDSHWIGQGTGLFCGRNALSGSEELHMALTDPRKCREGADAIVLGGITGRN